MFLDGADVRLYYELRGSGPLVALVGAPMGADAFAPLADLLATEYTVLTTDPRGVGRSALSDPGQDSTPELRAGDLSRLIAHVGKGPAAVLGSSGGAVTALALAQARPEQVRTVIAHEPPLIELLEDRDKLHAGTEDIIATYSGDDVPGAWRKFLVQANIFLPDEVFDMVFGGERDAQRAADEHHWFHHELRATTHWRPDTTALKALETPLVVGIGEGSAGQLCDRTSRALAAQVGVEPALFPGDHTGFVDETEQFAVALKAFLA